MFLNIIADAMHYLEQIFLFPGGEKKKHLCLNSILVKEKDLYPGQVPFQ